MMFDPKIIEKEKEIMLNAFLVALAVFICVGGAELIGFTMLNRPIVIGPLVGLFLGDVKTGVMIGASLEAVFMGVVISAVLQRQNLELQQQSVRHLQSCWVREVKLP